MAQFQDPARPAGTAQLQVADDARARSGVSWGAVLAGALGAASLSLILVLLGTGLGLSSISPWTNRGASATAIGVATILWITFTQIAASGIGGYLAGRLRTQWSGVHADERYFRDTAHGFLAWSLATLATAAILTSTLGAVLGTGAQAGASMAGGSAAAAAGAAAGSASAMPSEDDASGPLAYYVDALFRTDAAGAAPSPTVPSSEVARIFLNSIRTGELPAEDARYVGQLVAQRTGLPPPEADKRVNDTYARAQRALNEAKDKAKTAADAARKASAYASLWLFISLLIGAFVASFAATYGGRQRDR